MTWVQTYSGVPWQLDNPRVEDVRLDDIAHSLANICRYTGHSRVHFSVAQHSVLAYLRVRERFCYHPRLALAALLHDAHEAYVGDLSSPLKWLFKKHATEAYEEFCKIEARHQQVIAEWAGLPGASVFDDPAIKHADMEMLATERRDLLGHCDREWLPMPEPLEAIIYPQDASEAKASFLSAFTRAMNDAHGRGRWPNPWQERAS